MSLPSYTHKVLMLIAIAALSSCQEKPTTDQNKRTKNSNSKSVSIPMHGTKQNSSSSTNQSFKEQQQQIKEAFNNSQDTVETKQTLQQ